jgi:hypothetical protein
MKRILQKFFTRASFFAILWSGLTACSLGDKSTSLVFQSATRSIASTSTALNSSDYSLTLNMGGRRLAESTLAMIFGTTGTDLESTLTQNVLLQSQFGGGCDLYAASEINGQIEFPRDVCINGAQSVVNLSNSNPMRYATVAKMCDTLVQTSTSFNYAISKIYSGAAIAAPSTSAVTTAYQLFFPSETPDPTLVTSLVGLTSVSTSSSDAWKLVLDALCTSPEWQAL